MAGNIHEIQKYSWLLPVLVNDFGPSKFGPKATGVWNNSQLEGVFDSPNYPKNIQLLPSSTEYHYSFACDAS